MSMNHVEGEVSRLPVPVAPGSAPPPVPEVGPNLFARIHRLLEGRYHWAILLTLLGLAGGAYWGWSSTVPLFRSQGLLYVEPSLPSPADPEGRNVPPMLSAFIDAQVAYMHDRRVLRRALESDVWRAVGRPLTEETIEKFEKGISIERKRGALHLIVGYEDEEPRAAEAGVRALIDAYQALSREYSLQSDQDRLREYQDRERSLGTEVQDLGSSILTVAEPYGSPEGLASMQQTWNQRLTQVISALGEVQRRLRAAGVVTRPLGASPHPKPSGEEEGAGGEKGAGKGEKPGEEKPKDLTPEEIAVRSESMMKLLLERDRLQAVIKDLKEVGVGEKGPRMVAAHLDLENTLHMITVLTQSYNRMRATGASVPTGDTEIDRLKAEEAALITAWRDAKRWSAEIGKLASDIERLKLRRESAREEQDRVKLLIEQLRAELMGKGRIKVLSYGELPVSPSRDRRFRNAFFAGFGLGGLGLFLVILLGALDRRLRSSRDLEGGGTRVPVLGLLPEIPEDLGDPENRALATHAVHHIRTLLQIRGAREGERVFSVTGPGAGTGKTTLSFALGLSFGASGSRTLIIDGDLQGRGLTGLYAAMLQRRIERALPHPAATEEESSAAEPLEIVQLVLKNARPRGPDRIREILWTILDRLGLAEAREAGILDLLTALARHSLDPEEKERLVAAWNDWSGNGAPPEFVSALPAIAGGIWRPTGLLHALDGADLTECVEETGIDNLDILALERGAVRRTSELSMSFVARLVAQAREAYETVLLDTGPIPGSLEASLAAAEADGVVLAVSRGDDRVFLENAIRQLEAIGARPAGIVFNRAAVKDALSSSRSRSFSARSRPEA